jgi:hypothetical protein
MIFSLFDSQQQQLDTEPMQEDTEPSFSSQVSITPDDLAHIGQLHAEVFQGYTTSPWLSSTHPRHTPHFANPLLQRLKALKDILPSTLGSLDSQLDKELAGILHRNMQALKSPTCIKKQSNKFQILCTNLVLFKVERVPF